MRILFVMLHPGFLRNYESTLEALAERGHSIQIAWEHDDAKWGQEVVLTRLLAAHPSITAGPAPARAASLRALLARMDSTAARSGDFQAGVGGDDGPRENEVWPAFATATRVMLDTLRYCDPRYAGRDRLRQRAEKRLPPLLLAVVRGAAALGTPATRALAAALGGCERAVPVSPIVERVVRESRADLVVVTPLIEFGSQQVDYLKAARRVGTPTALAVASWDNLTTKGAMRSIPDRVIVWNETQRAEAEQLHGVPPDRVRITGAQLFDGWFDRGPRRQRQEFAARVGLREDRPILLYTGSSSFIAPNEWRFAARWIEAVRNAGDTRLAEAGILIRPHPANAKPWLALDLSAQSNVAIWPPIGTSAAGAGARDDFFDSLYHAAAVVGINTSALIEAAIVDRPVCTVLDPEFEHSQQGTIHFGRLLEEEGGPLFVARSLDEHVAQLGELVAGPGRASERNQRFVEAFVRPHGRDRAATPVLVEALEEAGRISVRAHAPGAAGAAGRALLYPAALVVRALLDQRPLWVYPLRPVLAGTLAGMSVASRLGAAVARGVHAGGKRARRAWRVRSHESGRRWRLARDRAAKRTRKGGRTAIGFVRRAGSGVKRLVGLSDGVRR